jgi:large subunit ribosomal protein L6e
MTISCRPKTTGNRQLSTGVMEKSRRQTRFVEKKAYRFALSKGVAKSPAAKVTDKPTATGSRYYPADDVKTPLKRNFRPTAAKLRSSITPGTVLIVLSGRFRGRRVVFLRQLDSGLLLVTGPFKVNGVPLRRMNQAYVIATSTKLDISGLRLPAEAAKDEFYSPAAEKAERKTAWNAKTEDDFFDAEGNPKVDAAVIPDSRKKVQAAVDDQILALPAMGDKVMRAYLASHFTLTKGQKPHAMKF